MNRCLILAGIVLAGLPVWPIHGVPLLLLLLASAFALYEGGLLAWSLRKILSKWNSVLMESLDSNERRRSVSLSAQNKRTG